jgi:SMI1 / KNR4 family (SUKH-1)
MDIEHTTPAHGQSHLALARVKDLLARLDSERESNQSQPAKESRRPYTAESCLTVPDLAAWEATNSVLLPEAYRLFLLEIGNGGIMPSSYCDFKMWHLDPNGVDARLREPFPLSKDRFEQRMARLQTEERGDDSLFPELNAYWDEGELPPGCLPLGRYPSYDLAYLIVSGELRGMVWCAVDGGIPELDRQGKPFDFLGWFEDTLLELSRPE